MTKTRRKNTGGDEIKSVGAVLDRAAGAVEEKAARVGDIVQALGRASFTPILLLPALLVVSPLSGVPLVSSFCGICIALISGQMLLGRDHIWLPQWIMSREIDAARFHSAIEKMQRGAGYVDGVAARRMSPLVKPPISKLLQALCLVCGAVMPVMELVPFTSTILGTAVALMAIALLVEDGLLALAAIGVFGGAIAVLVQIFL